MEEEAGDATVVAVDTTADTTQVDSVLEAGSDMVEAEEVEVEAAEEVGEVVEAVVEEVMGGKLR